MNSRFYEKEDYIKELISKDRTDGEIYSNLRELIIAYLAKKKCCNNKREIQELSHDIATEMYFNIADGADYYHILGWLEKNHKRYVNDYLVSQREIIDADVSDEMVYNTTSESFHLILNKVYLSEISKVIDETMRNCRYRKGTPKYNNLRLSLTLSLLRNKNVNYHLEKEDINYLPVLISDFKMRVIRDKVEYTEGGYYEEKSN